VCYLGVTAFASLAECLLRSPPVRILDRAMVDARMLTSVVVVTPLRLVAMRGPGLAIAGATAAIATGAHDIARQWSRALWQHPAVFDGITYRCRHDDDEIAVALFDRASRKLRVSGMRPVRKSAPAWGQFLDRYRLALDG
jgi:hypothetical protein